MNGLFLLFPLDLSVNCTEATSSSSIVPQKKKRPSVNSTYLWHLRLGHVNVDRINRLVKDGPLIFLKIESYPVYQSCLQGKMTKKPFPKKAARATELLELIHSDVCGPMSIPVRGGFEYFITFIDDCSRFGYIYLMHHKSESFEKFKEFKAELENN